MHESAVVSYKRSRFSSRLPADRVYTRSHFWLLQEEPGLWRVGFTKFATRMLGDLVEHTFSSKPGEAIAVGQTIGSVEGFKALTELYSVVDGTFVDANPEIDADVTLTDRDPYGRGWLYRARGVPDSSSTDVNGYVALLDATIDKMQQQAANSASDGGIAQEDEA